MRMLISAWSNGEPVLWYAMHIGLPETESVCIFLPPCSEAPIDGMSLRLDVRPIPAGWGGYIRSTADLGESR